LTLVAVFFNEELRLPGYFENVKGVFDEMIVVDCSSTDASDSICKKSGAEVISSSVRYFEQNVNKALSRVKGGWVLILDADERLSPELKKNVREMIADGKVDVYMVKRHNYLFSGFSKYETCNTHIPRLFRIGHVVREKEEPHETPKIYGRTKKTENAILHYVYPDVRSWLVKTEDYLIHLPEEHSKTGKKRMLMGERNLGIAIIGGRHGLRRLFIYSPLHVLNYLFRHQLILDGAKGIIFSICCGIYVFLEEAIYWQGKQKREFDWKSEYPDLAAIKPGKPQ
jgi:glycosyltransferase involved in cell wall biosynthesis